MINCTIVSFFTDKSSNFESKIFRFFKLNLFSTLAHFFLSSFFRFGLLIRSSIAFCKISCKNFSTVSLSDSSIYLCAKRSFIRSLNLTTWSLELSTLATNSSVSCRMCFRIYLSDLLCITTLRLSDSKPELSVLMQL